MTIFQLIGIEDNGCHRTLCVSEQYSDITEAMSSALGRGGWSMQELFIREWSNGYSSDLRHAIT